jgi:hypothetical protein
MKVVDDRGRKLDAEVSLQAAGDALEIVIESRGGGRNNDYIPAFELLLKRLAENNAELLSVELATRQVQKPLIVPRRRLPIQLKASEDTSALATLLRNAAAAAGREPGAKGMGNATKRLRIRFRLADGSGLKDNELIEQIVGPGASTDTTTGKVRTATRDARVTPRERRQSVEDDKKLVERTDLTRTEKHVVIKQRLAQRLFRERLKAVDCRCRLTGVCDPQHLRASHIKPWAQCDDRERQDPANGLLLAPHVDHLFDAGYLAFEEDGTVLVSRQLDAGVRKAWGLEGVKQVSPFSAEQERYLEYHRRVVFRKPPA